MDDAYGKQFEEFHVGFEGRCVPFALSWTNLRNTFLLVVLCCSFGSKHVTPRSLSADLLGCLVCVEGIITKSKPLPNFLPLL